MIQQFFKKLFGQFLQVHEEEILGKLCFWVVYYYISVPKFIVNSNGILVNTNQAHEEYLYDTTEDFLGEYSGKLRGGFYLEVGLYHIRLDEMVREKCREMIYAYYFPLFVYRNSLLCKEALKEIGVRETEIELGNYETLIFNHCVEIKEWIDIYEEDIFEKLFILSFPFIVHAYREKVRTYMKKEERQPDTMLLIH
ncbi:hypothetical protein [Bacillus gaemokensis]|uniref:Uncharacterized protein n=1 Tax=Bacillus gaemokensis TaxID=574375 RepID=A0A073K8V8_9BACI|nr:hypothetical protein [Bacillus gaemokensis]KEK22931.1 hypothetical protein BAGA_15535 [Bacillus gaemokensis]KYG34732.1 hypothetical protein AZF08_10140 [Bacillus gaemokensis]